jgi:hypothetical protein
MVRDADGAFLGREWQPMKVFSLPQNAESLDSTAPFGASSTGPGAGSNLPWLADDLRQSRPHVDFDPKAGTFLVVLIYRVYCLICDGAKPIFSVLSNDT